MLTATELQSSDIIERAPTVEVGGGNLYGLIGANGCDKSTLRKILGGELKPSAVTIAIESN